MADDRNVTQIFRQLFQWARKRAEAIKGKLPTRREDQRTPRRPNNPEPKPPAQGGGGEIYPQPKGELYRVLTDAEQPAKYFGKRPRVLGDGWDDKPWNPGSTANHSMTPATVKLTPPKGWRGKIGVSKAGAARVKELNVPHGTYERIIRTSEGWSNRGQTFPDQVEPIIFEGNYVDVLLKDETHNKAVIRMWHGETDDACVIHRWTNIDANNNLQGVQKKGTDGIGYIILDYPDGMLVELDRLQKV